MARVLTLLSIVGRAQARRNLRFVQRSPSRDYPRYRCPQPRSQISYLDIASPRAKYLCHILRIVFVMPLRGVTNISENDSYSCRDLSTLRRLSRSSLLRFDLFEADAVVLEYGNNNKPQDRRVTRSAQGPLHQVDMSGWTAGLAPSCLRPPGSCGLWCRGVLI